MRTIGSLLAICLTAAVALDHATAQTSFRRVFVSRVETYPDGSCVVQGFGPDRILDGKADDPDSYELWLGSDECSSVRVETHRTVQIVEGGIFHVRRLTLLAEGGR